MLKITDKSFRYTSSFNTDLRKKFKRMETELRAKREQEQRNEAEAQQKTVILPRARKA